MAIPKKIIFVSIPIILVAVFVFSFHVIRVDDGIEIVRKENFTCQDFYVDVRGFGLADYFYHAPKIRNYLFFEKPYERLLGLIEEKKIELETSNQKMEEPQGPLAQKMKPIERAIREWIEKILK